MKLPYYHELYSKFINSKLLNNLISKLNRTSNFFMEMTPKWFRFLEWLIISETIFLAFLFTKSIVLLVILLITAILFFIYLSIDIFNLSLKVFNKRKYGKIEAFISALGSAFIIGYLVFLITVYAVLRLTGVTFVFGH